MLLRFLCMLVFLGTNSETPIFSSSSTISWYHKLNVVSMDYVIVLASITSLTIPYAWKISWLHFWNFETSSLNLSRTVFIIMNIVIVWNNGNDVLNTWAFTFVSQFQSQRPVDDSKSGWSQGEMIASRNVTKRSYISRNVSRHVCLSTHLVSHNPRSFLLPDSGRYTVQCKLKFPLALGLLVKKDILHWSGLQDFKLLESCTLPQWSGWDNEHSTLLHHVCIHQQQCL